MKENTINIIINNKEDLYDKFNNNKLSKELGDYIYNTSLHISFKKTLPITFKSEKKKQKEIIEIININRNIYSN